MSSSIEKAMERMGAGPHGRRDGGGGGARSSRGDEARGEQPFIEIDLNRLRSQGLLVPEDHGSLAENYRAIKRPLLSNAFADGRSALNHSNLLVVTSAVPGEGKTFTSLNLSMSIAAELDHTVLLVDADPTGQGIGRSLGLQESPGLMDLLVEPYPDVSSVISRTNISTLRLLPSGARHPRSTELLSSAQMRRTADELARRYPDRLVIFDAPPILSASEALALTGHVGQVLMVVEAERTGQELVQEALEQLDQSKKISLVLNKTRDSLGSRRRSGYQGKYV